MPDEPHHVVMALELLEVVGEGRYVRACINAFVWSEAQRREGR